MAVSQCCCCRVAQCHTLNARSLFPLLSIFLCNLLCNSDKRSSSLPSLVKLPTAFLLYISALRVSIFTSFGFLSHLQLLPSPQHPHCSSPPFHTFVQHFFDLLWSHLFCLILLSSLCHLPCYRHSSSSPRVSSTPPFQRTTFFCSLIIQMNTNELGFWHIKLLFLSVHVQQADVSFILAFRHYLGNFCVLSCKARGTILVQDKFLLFYP